MSEEAKPIFPFGIPDISGLYQTNKEAPLWAVENRFSNELICLCWSKERANQIVKLLKEKEEVSVIPTNAVSVFTWQLLLLATIRKLTETLIEDHQFQQSEEPLFISNK
jgi:hypothetical protein